MDWKTAIFWAFAALAVIPGLMIVLSRDIVRIAFWLLAALGGVAGLYVTLGADFLGFTQVLVYIGGIMVLILFGIMMTHRDPVMLKRGDTSRAGVFAGILIAAATAIGLIVVVGKTAWLVAPQTEMTPTTAA